jgi:hypothetical protein
MATLKSRDWEGAHRGFAELAKTDKRHGSLASRYCGWCEQTLQEADTRWRGIVMVTFSDKSQYLDRFL